MLTLVSGRDAIERSFGTKFRRGEILTELEFGARSQRGSLGRLDVIRNPTGLITTKCAIPSLLRYCESGYFRIRGAHVKKLRKQPDKSLEPKGVPEDFEPQVINETDEGGLTIIVPARPQQKQENR